MTVTFLLIVALLSFLAGVLVGVWIRDTFDEYRRAHPRRTSGDDEA